MEAFVLTAFPWVPAAAVIQMPIVLIAQSYVRAAFWITVQSACPVNAICVVQNTAVHASIISCTLVKDTNTTLMESAANVW